MHREPHEGPQEQDEGYRDNMQHEPPNAEIPEFFHNYPQIIWPIV